MYNNTTLAIRLREVMLNGRWIANTNLREQLLSINWQQATQKVGNVNTIALLTFHLNYYLEGLLQVCKGGPLEIRDQYSFDMPPINGAADWDTLVQRFLTNAESFAAAVESMPEAQLHQPFVEEKYGTWLRNIEGVIEHSYYHFGQVSLLKKLTGES